MAKLNKTEKRALEELAAQTQAGSQGGMDAISHTPNEDAHIYFESAVIYLFRSPAHAFYFLLLAIGAWGSWSAVRETVYGGGEDSFAYLFSSIIFFVIYVCHLTLVYCSFLEMSDHDTRIGKLQFASTKRSWTIIAAALVCLSISSGKIALDEPVSGVTMLFDINIRNTWAISFCNFFTFALFLLWSSLAVNIQKDVGKADIEVAVKPYFWVDFIAAITWFWAAVLYELQSTGLIFSILLGFYGFVIFKDRFKGNLIKHIVFVSILRPSKLVWQFLFKSFKLKLESGGEIEGKLSIASTVVVSSMAFSILALIYRFYFRR
jgi:hypothetical protein